MMKLGLVIHYLKKIQNIYEPHDTPFNSTDISIFSPEISEFCYIKKYSRYTLNFGTLFYLFWVFKGCFNKHGYNFDDVSKNGYSRPS